MTSISKTPPSSRSFEGNNPWYDPGKAGLRIVAATEHALDYEFDIAVVWQDVATSELYGGQDSGCSCPTPFEDFRGLPDCVPIYTEEDAEKLFKGYPEARREVIKVRAALRERDARQAADEAQAREHNLDPDPRTPLDIQIADAAFRDALDASAVQENLRQAGFEKDARIRGLERTTQTYIGIIRDQAECLALVRYLVDKALRGDWGKSDLPLEGRDG